jgi:hypothetical protein
MVGITMQQAEKDFKMGEFYERTGHPASAYFYYEIVRRRYPGTPYHARATERMNELRSAAAESGSPLPAPAGPGTSNITPASATVPAPAPQTPR